MIKLTKRTLKNIIAISVLVVPFYLFVASAQNVTLAKPTTVENFKKADKLNIGRTYTVKGKKYTTLASSEGFVEEGTASWYGPGFHGKKTANGEIYNQNAMTAAHKYLPLTTTAKIVNLENGKEIVVKINDRGPYHGDRILDLSKAAAKELGVLDKGTAKIKLIAI